MKRFLTRFLILGLAVLPAQARAEAPATMPQAGGATVVVMPTGTKDQKPTPALDCPSPCVEQAPACSNAPTIMGFAEYLYWSVHDANIPYAQAFDGVDPFNSVPRGPVGEVAPHYQSGYRVGAGAAINEYSWVVGTYTYFTNTANSVAAAPNGDVLHSFLAFPNTVDSAGDSLKASAQFNIDLQMADLEYKCTFLCTDNLIMTWVAGARYGHLDQKLDATYDITGTTTVVSNINFDGGGPRAGLEGQYRVAGGLFGYGKGAVSLLAGQFSGSYTERNIFTGLVGTTSIDEERIVPILELELGLGWQTDSGRIRVTAGYYVGSWFNTMTIPTLANSIQNANFTTNANNNKDNITFDGLVGRIEFRF